MRRLVRAAVLAALGLMGLGAGGEQAGLVAPAVEPRAATPRMVTGLWPRARFESEGDGRFVGRGFRGYLVRVDADGIALLRRDETVRLRFPGLGRLRCRGAEPEGQAHHLGGRTHLPVFAALTCTSERGVTVALGARDRRLRYELRLHRRISPAGLRLEIVGARGLRVEDRRLCGTTRSGTLVQRPATLVRADGHRAPVDYRVRGRVARPVASGLDAGDVVDPVLEWTSLFGGSEIVGYPGAPLPWGEDRLTVMDVDLDGNVYLAGFTYSPDLPVTPGAYRETSHNVGDTFIAKLDPSGRIVYATYVGRTYWFLGGAVDEAGRFFLTWKERLGHLGRLSADGSALELDVDLHADAMALALHEGDPVLSGGVTDPYFKRTPGTLRLDPEGRPEGFVARYRADDGQPVYAGVVPVRGMFLALDEEGGVYRIQSSSPIQTLTADTAGITARRFLVEYTGAKRRESPDGLVVSADTLWTTGTTSATDLPLRNAFDTENENTTSFISDAFIAGFRRSDGRLRCASYFGGPESEYGGGLAVTPQGEPVFVGQTRGPIPMVDPIDDFGYGWSEAFVAILDPETCQLSFSSYLGGTGPDAAYAVRTDACGNVYVGGMTDSADFPGQIEGARPYQGGGDSFVTKIVRRVPDEDDRDCDGISDAVDDCPRHPDPAQADLDGDGVGDPCDLDRDGDGVPNARDNCPNVPNPDQADVESDGHGDACDDADHDGDGILDGFDDCPYDVDFDQTDSDGNGVGDACDLDGDGLADRFENCETVYNPDQADLDGNGIGDACDPDMDGDGLCDDQRLCSFPDNCPTVANPGQENSDADPLGDACDPLPFDTDNDGIPDDEDNCRTVPNPDQADSVGKGMGNACYLDIDPQKDQDGDGYRDIEDNCIWIANPDQADANGDHQGDVCEDPDHDGKRNGQDNCPDIYNPMQEDADRDGIGDACDPDAGRADGGAEDAGAADAGTSAREDSDRDGVANVFDNCPVTRNPDQRDGDGDGRGDACDPDRDDDGVANDVDNCPDRPNLDQADTDGNGIGDRCQDTDGDGRLDVWDACPLDADPVAIDTDGDGTPDACDETPLGGADAGPGANVSEDAPPTTGCACAAGPGGGAPAGLWPAMLLGLALLRRRPRPRQ